MHATAMIPQRSNLIPGALGPRFMVTHDNWLADVDRFLAPMTNADLTFWERWAAVRFVEDQLLQRVSLEQALLKELRPFLTPEINERLRMQADRLNRLLRDFARLGRERVSDRQRSHLTRHLLDALRLWYAEIEFAAGGIRWSDLNGEGQRLLAELNPCRCGWADAYM